MDPAYHNEFECAVCSLRFNTALEVEDCFQKHVQSCLPSRERSPSPIPSPPSLNETFLDCDDDSETLLEQQNRGRGGKRAEFWTFNATERLLTLVKERMPKLNDRRTKKNILWRAIAAQLRPVLPGVTFRQAETKWRQLKNQYRSYEDNKTKTGRGRKVEPLHYNVMVSILKHRPLTQPPYLLEGCSNTSGSSSTSATSSRSSTPSDNIGEVEVAPNALPEGVASTSSASGASPAPRQPGKSQKMRPASEKATIMTILNDIRADNKAAVEQHSALYKKQIDILSVIADRGGQREEVELALRKEQIALVKMELAEKKAKFIELGIHLEDN